MMGAWISRLFGFVFSGALWVFIGLVVLAYMIWTIGPSIAVGQWYPLESEDIRQYVIIAIFSIWLLRIIWRKYREGRLNAQLLGQLRKTKKSEGEDKLPAQERAELRILSERFDEAIQLLRDSRFDDKQSTSPLARFSKHYLYQLPWYVFIGAPGSGKTTALVNSGLTFPLAEKFGKVALKGVGGTKNCDWWFTDEAVLLDTAGRYTTHESDPTGDEEEWRGFLSLLAKYRGRQPINGVMLTVSVADLLSVNATDRAQHAAVLKRRLQELRENLGIEFPVYILVTKTDLLSGFEEYFSSLSRDELNQVWGFTFPYEESQIEDFKLLESYDREYLLLQQRLFDALPDILVKEQDETKRALAYLLPQQFANLRIVLGSFLSELFATSRYEEKVILRGVYFTSGTQGGLSFDKVTSQLRRYMKIDGIAQLAQTVPMDQGKSFFLNRLLKDVVFKEAGLAGLNIKWERRYRRIQWAAYLGMGALLLGTLFIWGNSYLNNVRYTEYVDSKLPALRGLSQDIKITQEGDVLGLLPFMNSNVVLADGENFLVGDAPFSYGFGLYQGHKLEAASDSVYKDTLRQVLLPQIAKRIEASLQSASPADLEYSYEALRAYLMMYDVSRYDASFMKTWIMADLSKIVPPSFTRQHYKQLEHHINQFLDLGVFVSPFPKNEGLIKRVRDNLDRYSLQDRAYSRLKRVLANVELKPSTIVSLAGSEAPSVFRRKSGKPINEGVLGLYSYHGYWNVFDKNVEKETLNLRRDDAWVLEVDTKKFGDGTDKNLINDVKALYFNDYIKHWDAYLADVSVREPDSLMQGIELVRSLSSSNSPLAKFAKSVANETTLLREDENNDRSIIDRARERVSGSASSLTSIIGPVGVDNLVRQDASPEQVEEMVDRHFVRYRELATSVGQNQAVPIDGTISLLAELYTYLTAADSALRSKSPLPPADVLSKLQAESGRLPGSIGEIVNDVSVKTSRSVSETRQESVGQDVNAVLGNFCRSSIAGRYPFANSSRDVAPNDFARFFGPGQLMDMFYQQNLDALVDRSTRPWRFKPGIDGTKGDIAQFLISFERASVIRDVYFAAGKLEPSYKVAIRPIAMDPEIHQFILEVDGQILTYEHGPQVGMTVEWPGTRGSNQVNLSLSPQQGTSGLSTSGPWALNRLLDRASIRPGKTPEQILASFSIGGRQVTLEFTAYSAKSPFRLAEMRSFACPGKG